MKIQRSRLPTGLLLTALLHVGIFAVLTQRLRKPEPPHVRRDTIAWVLPLTRMAPAPATAMAMAMAMDAGLPPPLPLPRPRANDSPRRTSPATAVAQRAPTPASPPPSPSPSPSSAVTPPPASPAPARQQAEAAIRPAPDDPFAQPTLAPTAPTSPTARDIVQQARLDVGRIDRQLRKDYPERFPLPPPDSKQATLERGFNAAHEAVPPKWYEGAKIVELSTPDGENRTRTYKIITAVLSYCINVHADGRKSYTNCPK